MNLITVLQFMMKLLFILLMALLPLYRVLAQEAGKQEQKMHIKMIRTVDGKTVTVDTTFTAETHDEIVKAIQAARLDTATMRMLRGKSRTYTLKGDKVELGEGLKGILADTAMLRNLRDMRMQVAGMDSLSGKVFKHVDIIRIDGSATNIKGSPRLFLHGGDSLATFHFKDSKSIEGLNPAEIERIVMARIPSREKIDSLLKLEGKSYIKIDTDEESGSHRIYRIEADGKQVEVKGEDIGLGIAGPRRAIFLVRQAKVEDITATDKQQLKDAGAPIETKSREELKVEEINYYPNPNNGRFNLSFTLRNKGTTVVRIMDSKGDEVFVDTVEKLSGAYSREIDISVFGRGMYFLQVAQNGRYHTKKLLVQ